MNTPEWSSTAATGVPVSASVMVDRVQYDSVRRLWLEADDLPLDEVGLVDEDRPVEQADLEVEEQAQRRRAHREAPPGLVGQHADHLDRHDRSTPRRGPPAVGRVPRVGLGDLGDLLGQRERVERPVALVVGDRHRLVVDDRHADLEPVDDEQLAGIALARPDVASSSVCGWSGPTDAVPVEHRLAVELVRFDARRIAAGRRQRRLHLLAVDDHGPEVGADAAVLEPRLAPQGDGERDRTG